jgi:DNA adenine methylase
VNVASVAQRSPLRYPGGKTWLIPHVRAWLGRISPQPGLLLEPFCGGGVVSLSAVMEGWVGRCCMSELDRDVAAFWHAALRHGPALAEKVLRFDFSRAAVNALAGRPPRDVLEHGFRTLVLNRTRRGGILAPGAAFTKTGENGKGLASRWYPETIAGRLQAISARADRIGFFEGNGMALLEAMLGAAGRDIAVFVDPPYTAGGKRAGRRLYTHHEIDHGRLFELLDDSAAEFLMTYDEAPEIVSLARKHGFHAVRVVMKNGHHKRIPELVVTPRAVFG